MQIINSPNYSKIENDNTVFLVTNNKYSSWQNKFIELISPYELNITVLDPYNKDNQIEKLSQLEWENNGLRISTCVIFWFSNDDFEPMHFINYGNIITENYQKIIVGCDSNFKFKLDIEILSQYINDEVKINSSLSEVVDELVNYINSKKI